MASLLALVKRYLAEGFGRPHPIPRGEKGPRINGWNDPGTTFAIDQFNDQGNVGTVLIGDLVDVDLDEPEARAVAPSLLPDTGRIHGRASAPRSHYWYRAGDLKPEKFTDVDGAVLVEIRTGSDQQTVLPPSVHPSGEIVEWDKDGEPGNVLGAGLRHLVRNVAIAALLARHWPKGTRHDVAGPAAGLLAARGLDTEEIVAITRDVVQRINEWFDADGKRAAIGRVERTNEQYAVLGVGNRMVVAEFDAGQLVELWPFDEFKKRLVKEPKVGKQSFADYWLQHPKGRHHNRLVYVMPGSRERLREHDYNGWQGYTVAPAPGDWSRNRDHLFRVICRGDRTIFDWVINWLRALFQLPGRHAWSSIVLTFNPQPDGSYAFKGTGTVEPVIAGLVRRYTECGVPNEPLLELRHPLD